MHFFIEKSNDFLPKMKPTLMQNGAQNRLKSSTKIMIKCEGFQVPLGSVLGPSWAVWELILGTKIMNIHGLYNGFVNIVFFEEDIASKCILDRSWVDFDAKRGPKRLPNRTQNGAKVASKICQRIKSVFDRS